MSISNTLKFMPGTSIDLYTLQTKLKTEIEQIIPSNIWVRAEISAIKARQGGHCYLELSQSGDNGLIAKAGAIIWASKYRYLSSFFKSVTGTELSEGMRVLVRVQVNYSQLYGLSLIIDDIDAEFTLGENELLRQQTINRLQAEGMMDLQKRLSLPFLPYNLAVISAEDAAGYGDFIRHIHNNEYGFVFNTVLFPAKMQGVESPSSISNAINLAQQYNFDAILILRGGGAKLDLACYDDYSLAISIAKCPLPVITAVGHERDYHVCDMVAYGFEKTPTALADRMLSCYIMEDSKISSFVSRLTRGFEGRLYNENAKLESVEKYINTVVSNRITTALSKLDYIEMKITTTDPRNVLARGFSIATDVRGQKLSSVEGRNVGDTVYILFQDGKLKCDVVDITYK